MYLMFAARFWIISFGIGWNAWVDEHIILPVFVRILNQYIAVVIGMPVRDMLLAPYQPEEPDPEVQALVQARVRTEEAMAKLPPTIPPQLALMAHIEVPVPAKVDSISFIYELPWEFLKKQHGIELSEREPDGSARWLYYKGIEIQIPRNINPKMMDEFLAGVVDGTWGDHHPIFVRYGGPGGMVIGRSARIQTITGYFVGTASYGTSSRGPR